MADDKITRRDIRDQLVKSLKPIVEQMRAKEEAGAEALKKSQQKKFSPGDTVRLTGKFLRNTGQAVGGEGTKRFKVVEHKDCGLCGRGNHVAVDEEGYGTDGPRHFAVGNLEHSKLKKDDGTGMSTGSDMSMNEEGVGASMMKCGPACSGGKHDHPMTKDEEEMDSQESTPCGTCGGALQIIGALGNRQHSMCRHCGMSYSSPITAEPGGPAASADDPMGKAELDQVKSAPEKTEPGADVPDGPGKEIDAEGSGSDPKKGRMAKGDTWNPSTGAADEAHVRGSVAAKMAPTPGPKKSPKDLRGTPENKIKPLAKGAMPGMGTANPPAQKARIMDRFRLGQGGTPAGARVPLPGITAPVRAPGAPPPTPAAAMKPGQTVMSKLRGGATSPAQANKEIGGFKSLAGQATHLAPMGKAALPAAPAAPKAPSMAAPAASAKNTVAAAAGAKPASAKPMK